MTSNTKMKTQFYEDINIFYDVAFPFLLKCEVENGLLLSILNNLKENIYRYGKEMPLLLALIGDDEIKLIALMTPPYNLIISYTDDMTLIEILIEELLKQKKDLPGVTGFKDGAKRFTQLWCESKNLKFQIIRNERIYKLEKVSEDISGNREFFVGNEVNQSLILNWTRSFMLEALAETNESLIARSLEGIKEDIINKKVFLLKDKHEIVSMARKAGKTPSGNLVNLVYTPPELRRRGYATECVAKLSKHLLEQGNTFCFLFTDLSNPVSNSIYQKIGYRAVIDFDEIKFTKQ